MQCRRLPFRTGALILGQACRKKGYRCLLCAGTAGILEALDLAHWSDNLNREWFSSAYNRAAEKESHG